MDINKLSTAEAHEKAAEMCVRDRIANTPTDFFITIRGVDSPTYRKALTVFHRAILKGDDDANFALMAAVTVSWRGLTNKGKKVECNEAAAVKFYKSAPYIARQIEIFINQYANFTTG